MATQPVGGGAGVVAVHQAVGHQLAVHGVQGRQPHRVVGATKPTRGIISSEASSTSVLSCWVKARRLGFQPRSMIWA